MKRRPPIRVETRYVKGVEVREGSVGTIVERGRNVPVRVLCFTTGRGGAEFVVLTAVEGAPFSAASIARPLEAFTPKARS